MNPITIGGLVVIGVLTVALTAMWKVAGHEREQRAIAEASAAAWQQTAAECSAATDKARVEADNRAAAAQAALGRVRAASAATETEIARLRSAKPSGAACPAADGVQQVRQGLK